MKKDNVFQPLSAEETERIVEYFKQKLQIVVVPSEILRLPPSAVANKYGVSLENVLEAAHREQGR